MRYFLTIFSILLFFACNNNIKNFEASESDWKQAEIAFGELKQALEKDNKQIWNYSLEGPLMLVNSETRIYIANVADNSGKSYKKGDLWYGKLPEKINIANTVVEWDGQRWTMVALPLPDAKAERLSLLIHESFHRIQPSIGFASLNEIQCKHLDVKEGRIFLKLELEALKKALNSVNPEVHIKDALNFRHYRHQLFSEAKMAENSLELNEGLAEYTGSILSERNDADLKLHYTAQIDRIYNKPSFVRSFAYYTIPVYGYFMQLSEKKWNLRVTQKTNLSAFISDFFGVKNSVLKAEHIEKLGKKYDLDSIVKCEIQRELIREELIKKYKKVFLSDSVVNINLENLNFSFNPSNVLPLDSFGIIYPNLRISDNWGILEVDCCGALINPAWNKVTISYPIFINEKTAIGKGWKLKINASWKLEKAGKTYCLIKK